MTNLSSTIELIFKGIDQASDTTKNIVGGLDDLRQSAANIADPFANLADRLAFVQGALLAVAGVIGTLAYKEAVEFESSLLDLQKQMEEGEGSARDFAAGLEELAVKYGQNANELVQSAADFKAAGYDLDTSTKLVEQSLQLVIAGGVDAGSAVDIMNRSLAGFQVPAAEVVREAQHIGDVLNKTADLTKSSFTELAAGFSDLSPIARLAGLSFEETGALLSKVIDVFGSGSEAANGLKSGFLSLIDPSKEAAAALQNLGVQFDAAGKPIGSVKEILATLAPAFNQLNESQKLAAASTLFGKDQAAKLVAVLGEYAGAMELAAKVSREAGGSIEKEVALRLKSAEAQIASTNEAWRQLLRALGDKILIDVTGIISSLGDLGLSMKRVVESGGLDPLFDLLRPQLQGLEEMIRTVAKNLPAAMAEIDFSALVKAFENLGVNAKKALEALFGPIDLSTIEGLRNAIQQVIDVLSGLVNVTAGELGGFAPFLDGVRKMVTAFKDAPPAVQGVLGELLGFAKGVSNLTGALEPVNTALLSFIAFGSKLAVLNQEVALLAAGLAGPQGLAVALGAATAALITFLVPAEDLADYAWPDWLAGYEGATWGTALFDIGEGFSALGDRIKKWMGVMDEADPKAKNLSQTLEKPIPVTQWDGAISAIARYEAAIQDNKNAYNAFLTELEKPIPVTAWDGMISRLDELAGNTGEAAKQLNQIQWGDSGREAQKLDEQIRRTDGAMIAAGKSAGELGGAMGGVSTAFSQVGSGTIKATGAFAEVTDKTAAAKTQLDALTQSGKLTVDQMIEVTKNANDFKSKMEEIASNERIKTIEATISLKTAGLQADMERVKAAFASIDSTVQSTGDLLGSLFGNLTSTDNRFKELEIQEQIDLENKRRQEALDIQKKLAEAEIERIEAQTAALNRGDALIQIDGTGLAPELEAFMWKILGAIRTRANAEFADYLLGLGV